MASSDRYCHQLESQQMDISCGDKMRHTSLQIAYENLLEIEKKPKHGNSELTIYMCDRCGCYHIGHKPKWESRNQTYTKAQVERILGIGAELPAYNLEATW